MLTDVMTVLEMIFPWVFYAFLTYVITGLIFIFTAQLNNEDGEPCVDTESLHFKIAFPFTRYNDWFMGHLKDGRQNIGICGYFAKFFFTLYLAWPFIIVFQMLKTILYTPFLFSAGYYLNPFNLNCMTGSYGNPFDTELKKFRVPKIHGVKLYPIFLLVPAIYILSWIYFPSTTWIVTGEFLIVLGVIVVAALIFATFAAYSDSESGKVGLFKSWIEAKKRMVCPILKFH